MTNSLPELPKWPQMRLRGKKLTEEQTVEYFVKTDGFFDYPCTNNRDGAAHLMKKFGMDRYYDLSEYSFRLNNHDEYKEFVKLTKHLDYALGDLPTQGIMSSFIGGANSMVDWMGNFEYHYNVGKWPEVEGLQKSFEALVQSMPFLECDVVLMSKEDCEDGGEPLYGFVVKDGKVEGFFPADFNESLNQIANNFYPQKAFDFESLYLTPTSEMFIPPYFQDKVVEYLKNVGWIK